MLESLFLDSWLPHTTVDLLPVCQYCLDASFVQGLQGIAKAKFLSLCLKKSSVTLVSSNATLSCPK
jgi:hypothetical protein